MKQKGDFVITRRYKALCCYIEPRRRASSSSAGYGIKFRLLDDDGNVYFHGKCITDFGEEAFAPLDDFGAAYGCTDIQYRNEKGEWESL